MGTLFDQTPRNLHFIDYDKLKNRLKDYIKIANELKCSLSDVIEADKVLELDRKNNVYIENGDIHDEQMAGFGLLIKELINTLKELNG